VRQLEPFIELLRPNLSWGSKRMRLAARAAISRRQFGPEWDPDNRKLDALNDTVNEVVTRLNADAYSGTFMLPPTLLQEIQKDIQNAIFINRQASSDARRFDFRELDNSGAGGIYANLSMHENSPALKYLIANNIEPVAKGYLGKKCRFLNSQVFVTFPGPISPDNKDFGWHYDLDDYKFLKFFCYLNDVDDSSGPHALIPGSHHSRSVFRFFNRQLPDNIAERLGTPRTLTGPAGMCFFEDTIIYHKGVRPTKRPRVILQVEFGVAK
jgi:hypothetical protein